ncbi:MAG: hypothetical protein QNJ35_18200, partial [Paracoccaceae bacterium]|nr:hypothetical protein [Paracoccaceae bacterium]
ALSLFDFEDLRANGPVVDYILGARPGGGVFAVGYHEQPFQQFMMNYYKMGLDRSTSSIARTIFVMSRRSLRSFNPFCTTAASWKCQAGITRTSSHSPSNLWRPEPSSTESAAIIAMA